MFKPYAGVSTAILLFTKTNSGGTDHVWFYDVDADGLSLDDKRTPLLAAGKARPGAEAALTADEHAKNNLPDVLARWHAARRASARTPAHAQSFCVPKADIAAQGYDLSLNRYKEVVHEEVAHRPPREILPSLGEAGGGDSAGHEGTGGDAEVSVGENADLKPTHGRVATSLMHVRVEWLGQHIVEREVPFHAIRDIGVPVETASTYERWRRMPLSNEHAHSVLTNSSLIWR